MAEYSFLEVSKQFNLTKGAIRARMQKAPEGCVIDKDGRKYVTPQGIAWLSQEYGEPKQKHQEAPQGAEASEPKESPAEAYKQIMAQYERMLADKDREIEYLKSEAEKQREDYRATMRLLEDKQSRPAEDPGGEAEPKYKKSLFGLYKKIN